QQLSNIEPSHLSEYRSAQCSEPKRSSHMSDHVKEHAKIGNVEEFVRTAIQGFVNDPPDSDFQCGYLGAMLVVAKEAIAVPMEMSPYAEAQKLWDDYEFDPR